MSHKNLRRMKEIKTMPKNKHSNRLIFAIHTCMCTYTHRHIQTCIVSSIDFKKTRERKNGIEKKFYRLYARASKCVFVFFFFFFISFKIILIIFPFFFINFHLLCVSDVAVGPLAGWLIVDVTVAATATVAFAPVHFTPSIHLNK